MFLMRRVVFSSEPSSRETDIFTDLLLETSLTDLRTRSWAALAIVLCCV